MNDSSYFQRKARRYRNAGFACLSALAVLLPLFGAFVLRERFWLSLLCGTLAGLLFCAGMALLAAARRNETRAVAEAYFRRLETPAGARPGYRGTLTEGVRR